MKKLFLAPVVLLLIAISAQAQTRLDSKAEVYANPDRAGGVYCPYPEGQPSPAKAPKGYKPFYLSHIGRHGSRYAIGSKIYTEIYDVWKDAADKGNLAPEGEKIWKAYQELYPSIQYREGKLTLKGQNQHRQIAAQIYRDFPALFKGKTRATVLSTASNRVIVSMMCFLDQMRLCDTDFTFDADYGREYYPVLVPESSDNPAFVPRVPFPESLLREYDKFAAECFSEEPFLKAWFKDPDAISMDKGSFFYKMETLVMDFPNLDFPVSETLSGIFCADDLYHMWQIQNYSDYIYTARAPGIDIRRCLEMSVTVKDIIDKFSEDTAAGYAMRLRFSHDTALMPLISYLGVNGMDVVISDPREVEYYWRNYSVPMGCNLQIVFFRSSRTPDDILIQVLLNGYQATLPLPEAAPGFYHWADFVEKFNHLEI
ncbi:MAG: hypothetical protein J5675_00070 [Bacteroidales bacterium]|nr:hypothetical protein [Bacteroidales bacterium]